MGVDRAVLLACRHFQGDGRSLVLVVVVRVAHHVSAEHEIAEGRPCFVLVHRVVLGVPIVKSETTVGADDIVGLERRFGEREEASAGEALGRGLVLAELPIKVPLQKRGDPVVVLEVGLQVAVDLCLLGRHGGGRVGRETVD